jgi:2-dehydropantoate 2-reductase
VILTTKVQDSAKAIEGIKGLLRKDTVILILQNGIGNEEIVKRAAGKEVKVLRGVLKVAAEFVGPGVIKFWSGRTIIGQGEEAEEIVRMLNKCGLDAKLSENIDRDVWNKLVVNCVVNPLTAILRVTDGDIIVDSLKRVRTEVVSECIAVAEAEGIALAFDLAERIDRSVAGYANLSSMYQDIRRGKRTEIDYLNGKIVELGKKHGIPTLVNETLVGLIKFLEGLDGVSEKD